MVAEGEVEVLESSPDTLGGSRHSFASNASALLSQTFDAFHRVRRFKQEPRHQAPFSAVLYNSLSALRICSRCPGIAGEAPTQAVRPATRSGLGLLRVQELTDLGASKVVALRPCPAPLGCPVSTRLEKDFLIRSGRGWLDPSGGTWSPCQSRCLPYVEESVHACCRDDRPW